MNILYICQDYGIPVLGNKGASVHVREMIAALDRAGHQVALVSPSATKGYWSEPAELSARFLHIPADEQVLGHVQAIDDYCLELDVESGLAKDIRRILYDRELKSKLLRKFSKSPPDLIYVRAALHSVAPVALADQTGCPLLVELNAPLVAENTRYRSGGTVELASAAERKLLQAADGVLVVSSTLAEHAIELGVPADKVHVQPNAVDPSIFHPAPRDLDFRRNLGLSEGPLLGFVGGLRQWHGVEILPELLQRILPQHPGAQLAFIGSGPLEATLKQRLSALELEDHAVFLGSVEQNTVARAIREFSIALAPYPKLDHPFYFSPLKLFEYMACGVPVVAANAGQIGEIVENGRTGLLYEAGNLDELVVHCQSILDEPALGESLGKAAAETTLSSYTWEKNAQRVVEIANAIRS